MLLLSCSTSKLRCSINGQDNISMTKLYQTRGRPLLKVYLPFMLALADDCGCFYLHSGNRRSSIIPILSPLLHLGHVDSWQMHRQMSSNLQRKKRVKDYSMFQCEYTLGVWDCWWKPSYYWKESIVISQGKNGIFC